jgi:hypothetical protein
MEPTYSSEKWFDFQRTALRYIPEKSTLNNYRRENLKSYNFKKISIIPIYFPQDDATWCKLLKPLAQGNHSMNQLTAWGGVLR